MRIVEIREMTMPIASPIRNAYIDFSKMTLSLVAVVTDVIRDGKPVVGYGFNSNGRYGQGGLMRERFIPRILEADPAVAARRRRGDNLDPHKIWAAMMHEREAGRPRRALGRGRHASTWRSGTRSPRSRASRCSGCWPSATATATPNRSVFVYAAGGYYYPGKDLDALQDEMRSYLDRGYTVVKMKIGGALARRGPAPHRGGAGEIGRTASSCAVDANGRFDLETAHRLRQGAVATTTCSGTRRPGDPLDYELQAALRELLHEPDGDRREPVLDAGRAQPDPLRRHAPRPRLAAVRLRADATAWSSTCARSTMLRSTAGRRAAASRTAATRCRSTSPPASASAATSRYPDLFQPFGGFPDGVQVEDGYVTLPELPGIGFEGKSDLIKVMRELAA